MNIHDRIRLVLASIAIATSGCVTTSTDSAYMASAVYQERSVATGTLFKGDEEVMGGDSIEKILNSKIVLPEHTRLAVMSVNQVNGAYGLWSPEFAESQSTERADVLAELKKAKRLADVALLPSLLTPEKKGIPQLREAAARFQSQLLLVYQTQYSTFGKWRFVGKDEARTYCKVEAALLDVKTGLVPFTAVSLQEYKVEKQAKDMNLYESSMKAQLISETKALKEIAGQLRTFLNGIP